MEREHVRVMFGRTSDEREAITRAVLTDRYLDDIAEGSGASRPSTPFPVLITDETLAKVRALSRIAARREQTLAQMAIAATLRDPPGTSTLAGASSVEQLEENVAALHRLVTAEELADVDRYATESDIDLWAEASAV